MKALDATNQVRKKRCGEMRRDQISWRRSSTSKAAHAGTSQSEMVAEICGSPAVRCARTSEGRKQGSPRS